MAKDNLVEFSRSPDVLYAIDAKAGNGRLLSPIQGKLTLLDQAPTASTFEEKMGYLKNSGCTVENGEWQSNSSRLFTPIDLRGRDKSFTIVCKGTIPIHATYYNILYAQGSIIPTNTATITAIQRSPSSGSIYCLACFEASTGELSYSNITLTSSTVASYLDKESVFVHVIDFENRVVKIYVDGELLGSAVISTDAVCINNTSNVESDSNATLNLFNGNYIFSNNSSISYFAFVDYAMSAEEIKALGGA